MPRILAVNIGYKNLRFIYDDAPYVGVGLTDGDAKVFCMTPRATEEESIAASLSVLQRDGKITPFEWAGLGQLFRVDSSSFGLPGEVQRRERENFRLFLEFEKPHIRLYGNALFQGSSPGFDLVVVDVKKGEMSTYSGDGTAGFDQAVWTAIRQAEIELDEINTTLFSFFTFPWHLLKGAQK